MFSNALTFNNLHIFDVGGMRMKNPKASKFFTGAHLLLNRLDHDAA
jgi:hypothetical protein